MNREEYIAYRDSEDIPIDLLYQYWLDMGGKVITLEEFNELYNKFVQFFGKVTIINNKSIFITFDGILDKAYKHFNKKFEL